MSNWVSSTIKLKVNIAVARNRKKSKQSDDRLYDFATKNTWQLQPDPSTPATFFWPFVRLTVSWQIQGSGAGVDLIIEGETDDTWPCLIAAGAASESLSGRDRSVTKNNLEFNRQIWRHETHGRKHLRFFPISSLTNPQWGYSKHELLTFVCFNTSRSGREERLTSTSVEN